MLKKFALVLALPALITMQPWSDASAQVPTVGIFSNYTPNSVVMNMDGEITQTLGPNGGSYQHTSYFSKSFLGSGERVYRFRLTRPDGGFLCEAYVRINATSTVTLDECVIQSWTGASGIKCSAGASIQANSGCRASLSVDD